MSLRFTKLDRAALRKLGSGEIITEHGVVAKKLANGDTRWAVKVMVDGKRIHRWLGRESDGVTRSTCERFIETARVDARASRLNLPTGRKLALTFSEASDLYLKKLKEVGGKDYRKNDQHLRLHLKPYFGSMHLDRITTFTLEKYRAHCRKKGLAEATINRTLATYRRMGRRLARWKEIAAPLPMIELQKEDNARGYVLSAQDEKRLIEVALADSHPYIWLFIKVGLATSLRHAEILSARFEKLYPERRRLEVRVKGGKWRQQPLTRAITELLLKERDMATDQAGWIFPSAQSESGHIRQMSEPFARCVKAAGMDPKIVVPHTLRHTAITRLAATGVDIKTLQEFSGHESMQMVLRYAHAQAHIVDAALDRLDGGTVIEHPRARSRHDP
jgi:integrase